MPPRARPRRSICAMPQRLLVHHRHVVRRRLIVHTPAAIGKRQLATPDEAAHEVALGRVELAPPALKEGLLDVGEFARRVAAERPDDD